MTRRLLPIAGAVAALVLVLGWGLRLGVWTGDVDLQVYRAAGRAWLDGDELYGVLPGLATPLPFTYPPTAAVLFAPLAAMPFEAARAVLFGVSVLAVIGTCLLVLNRLRPTAAPEHRAAAAVAVTAAALAATGALPGLGRLGLEPVRETLAFGQLNLILMFLVAADLLVTRPRWPRGALIGFAAAVKLTPLAFLLFFVVRRDRRALAVAVVSTLLWTELAFLLAPADARSYWLGGVLTATERIGDPGFASNQSVIGMLARLGVDGVPRIVGWLGLSAVIVIVAAAVMRRCAPDGTGAVDAMLINAVAMLLISPVSWSHHWVWVAPALLAAGLALSARPVPRSRAAGTLVAGVVFVVAPHWLLPHRYGRERDWSWWQHLAGNAYVLTALLALALLAWRYRPVTPAAVTPAAEPFAAPAPPSRTSTRRPRSARSPADSVR